MRAGTPILASLVMQVDADIGAVRVDPREMDDLFGCTPVVVLKKSAEVGDRAVITIDFERGLEAGIAHLGDTGQRHIAMRR